MTEPFECPVCYTDGSLSGVLDPNCNHKICVSCYSTIILKCGQKQPACPCCRKQYVIYSDDVNREPIRQLARRQVRRRQVSSEEGFSMERLHEIMIAIRSFNN